MGPNEDFLQKKNCLKQLHTRNCQFHFFQHHLATFTFNQLWQRNVSLIWELVIIMQKQCLLFSSIDELAGIRVSSHLLFRKWKCDQSMEEIILHMAPPWYDGSWGLLATPLGWWPMSQVCTITCDRRGITCGLWHIFCHMWAPVKWVTMWQFYTYRRGYYTIDGG